MTEEDLEGRVKDPIQQAEANIVEGFNESRGNKTFKEILQAANPNDPTLGHVGQAMDNLWRKGVYNVVPPTPLDPKPLKYNPETGKNYS